MTVLSGNSDNLQETQRGVAPSLPSQHLEMVSMGEEMMRKGKQLPAVPCKWAL